MQNLLNIINSKINNLDSNIEELLYDEFLLTLQDIKKDFKNNSEIDLKKYFNKLNAIQNVKKNISSYLNSYNPELESNQSNNENIELDEAISVSSNISPKPNFKDLESKIKTFTNIPEDNYYFYNLNENYGEVEDKLNLTYSLKKLEDFNLFSIKISGLKLFDNVFLGRTLSESMVKLLSFLFMLNEKPFITICEKNSKYFSTSPSNMKKAITLKENKCYFESNVDESEAYEMIKSFLNHINIKLSACKVLLSCSTTKPNESYITFVL